MKIGIVGNFKKPEAYEIFNALGDFLSSQNISSEAGSEWVIGTCVKSPCVEAGNNELTSVYR